MNRNLVILLLVGVGLGLITGLLIDFGRDIPAEIAAIRSEAVPAIEKAVHDSGIIATTHTMLFEWLRSPDSTKQLLATDYQEWQKLGYGAPAELRRIRDSLVNELLGGLE